MHAFIKLIKRWFYGYSKSWEEDCERYWGEVLTGEGGHWCAEWDYLPIDETCQEMECCLCDLSCGLSGEELYRRYCDAK